MVRCTLVQLKTQKRTQRQRVGGPPCDAAFRIDAFEIPHQKCSEVNAGCQTRAVYFGVKRGTCRFGECIETTLAQQSVQTLIERVAEGSRKTSRFDPDRLLLLARPSLAQGHKSIVKRFRSSGQAKMLHCTTGT